MDVMYSIPSDDTVQECIVTRDAVLGKGRPILVHSDGHRSEAEAS